MRTILTALCAASSLALIGACSTLTDKPTVTETTPSSTRLEVAANQAFVPPSKSDPAADPRLWLEEVEGEQALNWVRAQNERSLAQLQADPLYAKLEAEALAIVNSKDRIPYGSVRQGYVYNFWQDETAVRGVWRKAKLDSYATDTPVWETILDIDALTAAEGANWVFRGANCHSAPGDGRRVCMITLSDGGKDAAIQREFDPNTKTFTQGGFTLPEAKQAAEWINYDTLLVGTDWGGDGSTLTESGYPSVVKRWTRGTPLESATTVFTADKTDVGLWPFVLELEDGRRLAGAVERDTFFTGKYWWFPEGETAPVQWPIPEKSTPQGVYKGKFLFSLEQDWAPEGQVALKAGDMAAFDVEAFLKDRKLPKIELVFRPTERQAVNGLSIAKGAALLSISDNVVGKLLRLEPTASGGWATSPVSLPGTGEVSVAFADKDEDTVFLSYDGFLTPDSLLRYDLASGAVSTMKSVPAKFNADGLVVHQREAVSKDGTKIPYFVVHREDVTLDGSTPTLLYGYGGFQISMTPGYSALTGKLWLERGGAYVLANIRGGGEFGPNWHQAGLKLNRQRIYDDFIAVGEDVVAKGLTSPKHLGIMGGSNGGLLMGVMLNQRPDLWNAVVVQVPLLDMLRFHLLLAGASWVDEYGSPDVAEERAFLETISPYQNFDPNAQYPTPFFVTSTKDDRVHPGHARKLAKLFEETGKPFLYYENIDGGHSAAANLKERAKRSALEYTYLAQRLGLKAE
jgi:prolyl oligopeptidase